jgi:hypothetical protein
MMARSRAEDPDAAVEVLRQIGKTPEDDGYAPFDRRAARTIAAHVDRLERDRDAALARAAVSARWSARWRSLADLYRTAARDYLAVTEAKDAALAAKGRAERALEAFMVEHPGDPHTPQGIRPCECNIHREARAVLAEARGEPGGEGA